MSEKEPKKFDCVKSMREIRDQISAEIADMSFDELSHWLEEQVKNDPYFSRVPVIEPQIRPLKERA